jgi:hypothetical protein
MFEVGLMQLLKNDSGVAALISGRLFGGRVPKDATNSTYPCAVWTVATTVDLYSSDGQSGYRTSRVQFDAYAIKYIDVLNVKEAIKAALQNFKQATLPDGTFVDRMVVIEDRDFETEPGISGQLYRRLLEVEIAYIES